jgi:hypothetical protein
MTPKTPLPTTLLPLEAGFGVAFSFDVFARFGWLDAVGLLSGLFDLEEMDFPTWHMQSGGCLAEVGTSPAASTSQRARKREEWAAALPSGP